MCLRDASGVVVLFYVFTNGPKKCILSIILIIKIAWNRKLNKKIACIQKGQKWFGFKSIDCATKSFNL